MEGRIYQRFSFVTRGGVDAVKIKKMKKKIKNYPRFFQRKDSKAGPTKRFIALNNARLFCQNEMGEWEIVENDMWINSFDSFSSNQNDWVELNKKEAIKEGFPPLCEVALMIS